MTQDADNVKVASSERNRRQHTRVPVQLPVTIRLKGGSSASKNVSPIQAITRDVSEGGMYIELGERFLTPARNLAIDNFLLFRSDLEIELKLPSQPMPIRPIGKAVWIEKKIPGRQFQHGIAISFKSIEDDHSKLLQEFLSRLL